VTGTARRTRVRATTEDRVEAEPPAEETRPSRRTRTRAAGPAAVEPTEAEPEAERTTTTTRSRRRRRGGEVETEPVAAPVEPAGNEDEDEDDEIDATGRRRRRRGRRGRGRGKGTFDELESAEEPAAVAEPPVAEDEDEPLTRRRRRRRRSGAADQENGTDDGVVTVVKIRPPRGAGGRDEVQGVAGSTRLEAKRQRRRDGREQRRTRPPILTESEFLARREAVERVMVVRQQGDRTQVAVLEDKILVEHYVTRQSTSSMVGNVYLGKVQNVLPSMEAAFVDIGRGRNAVLYAGEVNWDASGLEGRARSIEQALKSGESVLVQVTKDPVGHKGARLTSHIALSGRHLVYVPNGHASGISRKLSDVERRRLRDTLKNLVPDGAGVIVRTAAEGAAEDDLARDVKRLQAQWEDIQAKAANGHAPAVLSAEPDLVIRVVRDLFNEDFREIVIQGADAYEQVESYLGSVSPDLVTRVRRHTGPGDVFAEWRVDEQILKGLDRKVYLPSGGHLVIDRTEAMTVVDVNTGKYTGAGGNLEETVTRNNLEAAEEIVRQLRLRDLGGIVVIDFIDMVLESNRELVLRRLTECLGRDRTKHQVTEITSLGLVQMTRKRIGQGLLEAFSETCEHCKGRGVVIHTDPVAERPRANVAEKVRAVAASMRGGERPGESTADGDLEVDDEAMPAVDDELDTDDEAPSARRRARRGGSRRRTRP
jgi:ribonuclease E